MFIKEFLCIWFNKTCVKIVLECIFMFERLKCIKRFFSNKPEFNVISKQLYRRTEKIKTRSSLRDKKKFETVVFQGTPSALRNKIIPTTRGLYF